jgi:hypothetical protein
VKSKQSGGFTDKELSHYSEVVSWAQGDACISMPFEVLRDLIARLRAAEKCIDIDLCRLDHSGNCQTHLLSNPCEVAEWRESKGE